MPGYNHRTGCQCWVCVPSATRPRSGATLEERFWSKVRKTDGCWLWTASVAGNGYGQFGVGKKMVAAHRMAYTLLVGPIPEGMYACHRCDDPLCVNPNHIFLGTQSDNIRDARSKGRLNQWNRGKAACKRGHLFDAANTGLDGRGNRYCRKCLAERRPYHRRALAEASA